jgi:hypothetical protein
MVGLGWARLQCAEASRSHFAPSRNARIWWQQYLALNRTCVQPASVVAMSVDSSTISVADVSVQTIVAIRGGGIAENAKLSKAWLVELEEKDGKEFMHLDVGRGSKLHTFLNGDLSMIERMSELRRQAVSNAIRNQGAEIDPVSMQPVQYNQGVKRTRRESVDEISAVVEIEIDTGDGIAMKVNVLTEWHHNSRLRIEYVRENIELLLKKVYCEEQDVQIAEPNVRFQKSRHAACCKYFDPVADKWKWKSMRVARTSNPVIFARNLHAAAKKCQEVYERRHNQHYELSDNDSAEDSGSVHDYIDADDSQMSLGTTATSTDGTPSVETR